MNLGDVVSPLHYARFFNMPQSLTTWDGFTSLPKEGVLRIFIALKNPSSRSGLNPRTLVLMESKLTIIPPRRHLILLV
jgi:hypothetical protein